MTGNKNAWRAPLAGLASVAMIATMGVAASTANAAAGTGFKDAGSFGVKVYDSFAPYVESDIKVSKRFGYGEVLTSSDLGKDTTVDGRYLTGFSYDLAGKVPATLPVAVKGDTKLFAQYTDAVKVTFDTNDNGQADGGDAAVEVPKGSALTAGEYNSAAAAVAYESKAGFAGWTTTTNVSGTSEDLYTDQALNTDTLLYPRFAEEQNLSVVDFHKAGNPGQDVRRFTLADKAFPEFRAPESVKQGNFKEWQNADTKAVYDFTAPVANDVRDFNQPDLTVKAVAYDKSDMWTIKYVFGNSYNTVNGAKGDIEVRVAGDQKAAQPSDPAYVGEQFTGWFTTPDKKTAFDFDTPVAQQGEANKGSRLVTVYSGWDTRDIARVVFNLHYYNWADAQHVEYVTAGSAVETQPEVIEDYYQTTAQMDAMKGEYTSAKITGWTVAGTNDDIDIVPNQYAGNTLTVDAKWSHTVSYRLNGDGGTFSNGKKTLWVNVADGESLADKLETPVRKGYTFLYWAENGDRANKLNTATLKFRDGSTLVDGQTIQAVWASTANQKVAALHDRFGLGGLNKQDDVKTVVNAGYTEASAAAYVDAWYKLQDEYYALWGKTGQALINASAKLVAKYEAAEALLERAGNPVDPPFSSPFVDVTVDTPHATDINKLFEMGVTKGWTEANGTLTFRPATEMNRQDYAAFLYRLAGSPEFDAAKAKNPFADVTESTPHFKEILWAASNGVIKGYEKDGKTFFEGMAFIQRQDALVMLYRLAGEPKVADDAANFADASKTPFKAALAWAKAEKVSEGYPDGSFGVGLNIIRQDMAAFLVRAANVLDK